MAGRGLATRWALFVAEVLSPAEATLCAHSITAMSAWDVLDVAAGHAVGVAASERAEPTPELIDLVTASYGLRSPRRVRDLGGAYNLNFLFVAGGERLVVRVYQSWVTEERLAAIQVIRERLRAGSWPIAGLRRTVEGRTRLTFGDRLVEVEEFVEAPSCMNTWPRFRIALRAMGRLHADLWSMEAPPAARRAPRANHIAVEDLERATAPAISAIRRHRLGTEGRSYLDIAERLVDELVAYRERIGVDLLQQLVHGDYWHNNVLFDGDRIVGILDFDFVGWRPRVDDLALTLFSLNRSRGLADTGPRRRQLLADLVDRYDDGADRRLSEDERRHLPYALARYPLTFLRDLAWQMEVDLQEHALAELVGLRGPEWEWALRVLRSRRWLDAFLIRDR